MVTGCFEYTYGECVIRLRDVLFALYADVGNSSEAKIYMTKGHTKNDLKLLIIYSAHVFSLQLSSKSLSFKGKNKYYKLKEERIVLIC